MIRRWLSSGELRSESWMKAKPTKFITRFCVT
jgi:hypothetical protein